MDHERERHAHTHEREIPEDGRGDSDAISMNVSYRHHGGDDSAKSSRRTMSIHTRSTAIGLPSSRHLDEILECLVSFFM